MEENKAESEELEGLNAQDTEKRSASVEENKAEVPTDGEVLSEQPSEKGEGPDATGKKKRKKRFDKTSWAIIIMSGIIGLETGFIIGMYLGRYVFF